MWTRSIAFASLFLFAPQAVNACIAIAPTEATDLLYSDAIIVGSVVDYERIPHDGGNLHVSYAIITFQTQEILKGSVPDEIEVYWHNSTFGIPEAIQAWDQAIVGVVSAKNQSLPLRGPSATIFPSHRPDLPQLSQAPCAAPMYFPATPENVARVRAWLESGPVEGEKLSRDIRPEPFLSPTEQRKRAQRLRVSAAKILAAPAIYLLVLGLFVVLAQRRRRQA